MEWSEIETLLHMSLCDVTHPNPPNHCQQLELILESATLGTVAPTTPPTAAPVLLPLPDSTPHSHGSAAHTQTLVEKRYITSHH